MTTTAVSVSMEGQNFWIVKSLPLETKTILDAKLLLNLGLMLPFYLLSQLLLLLALRPGTLELLWQVLIPGVLLLFSSVFGLTVNLHLPSLRWDSEVTVVKQSASALIGGMGGFLLALLCAVPAALATGPAAHVLKAALCLVLLGVTGLLYRNNSRFPLEELN